MLFFRTRPLGRVPFLAACLIVLGATAAPVGAQKPPAEKLPLKPAERLPRVAALRNALLTRLQKEQAKNFAGSETRDVSNGAFASLLLQNDAQAAQTHLRRVFARQNMDKFSPDFGNLPWEIDQNTITDANAIEFGTQAWGPVLLGYGSKLPPAFQTEMTDHVRAAFAAIRRHEVKVAYTNIYLMKTMNLLLMGQAVHDPSAEAEGREMLQTWLTYTRQNGIREFGSPTYYGVSLDSLNLGYLYAPRDKAQCKIGLDFFWADLCAHYFVGRQSLAGPHSRDYDFLRGGGGVSLSLFAEGLREQNITDFDLEKVHLVAGQLSPNGYHPDAHLLHLTTLKEKTVRQRWDASDPNAVRETYLTPDFALGATGGNYGPQDKMLSLEIAGQKDLPTLSLSPQDNDAPYGKTKILDKSGHSKPRHLPLNGAVVQKAGTLLALLCLDPRRVKKDATVWETSVLLPLRVDEIRVNGKTLAKTAAAQEIALPAGGAIASSVVGLRQGKVGVAVYFLQAETLNGKTDAAETEAKPAPVVLKIDAEGLANDAFRLTATHWTGAANTFEKASKNAGYEPVRVALLLMVAHCETAADFDALLLRAQNVFIENDSERSDIDGVEKETWGFTAHVGSDTLGIKYDVAAHAATSRTLNGKPVIFSSGSLLEINGEEVGVPLFGPK